jgi:hypothetical protein
MKLFDIVSSAFSEIRIGKKLLSLGLMTTAIMMAVSIILFNMAASVIPAFYAKYDSLFPDGLSVSMVNAEYEDIDKIEKEGLRGIDVDAAESFYVNGFSVSSLPDEKLLENCSFSFVWSNGSENGRSLPAVFQMDVSDNHSNNAWVYCAVSQKALFEPGSEVRVIDAEGNVVGTFLIKQCKVLEDDSSQPNALIFLPFATVYSSLQRNGIFLTHRMSGIVTPLSEYPAIKTALEEVGISVTSDIDHNIESLSSLQTFFGMMSVLMMVTGAASLINICNMFLKTRENYIILQKILGNTNKKLFFIYVVVIEIMIVMAVFIAVITVLLANDYIYRVIYSVFGKYEYANINTVVASLFAFAAANLSVFISLRGIARKIGKLDVISAISNND